MGYDSELDGLDRCPSLQDVFSSSLERRLGKPSSAFHPTSQVLLLLYQASRDLWFSQNLNSPGSQLAPIACQGHTSRI